MTTGLSIAVIVLAIVALWEARELLRLRADRAAADNLLPPLKTRAAEPKWPSSQASKEDLAVAVRALRGEVAELSRFINYRSQAFRTVHPGEDVPNLEQFVNMLMTGRIETFRLAIEQQLPMLAALRYASDEKLTDVVVGLRAAAAVEAKARELESAGSQSQLAGGARQEALPAAPAKPAEPSGDTAR